MKRLRVIFLLIVCIWILRESIFGLLVSYKSVAQYEPKTLKDPYWREKLALKIKEDNPHDIYELNKSVLSLISENLDYGLKQSKSDPNNFRSGDSSHCVGFSELHAMLLHYACISEIKNVQIIHHRGKISFFGFSLHSLFKSAFFKDHDYISVVENGHIFQSDASLYEYTGVAMSR